MKLPPTEAIDTAVMWLESNNGDNGESKHCRLVAKYLEHLNREARIRHEALAAELRRKIVELLPNLKTSTSRRKPVA